MSINDGDIGCRFKSRARLVLLMLPTSDEVSLDGDTDVVADVDDENTNFDETKDETTFDEMPL